MQKTVNNYYTAVDNSILSKLKGLEISTYVTIRKFMNWQTCIAKVGIRRLAEEMGVSKNTVLKYTKRLIEKGLIIKRTNYNPVKQEYDVNEYFFTHVVQKNKDSSSPKKTKQKHIDKEESMTLYFIKSLLLKKFGQDILDKALQQLKISTEKGTIVNDLYKYLTKLCTNLKKQYDLIKEIPFKKENNPSAANTRAKINTFHNFEQRTSKYSAKDLEAKVRFKF
ncbi:Lrp/AsnC family transcriptional regulator [Clostridium sp. D2Q-11]|uniref:Lrp/AsnC family transcriptional regulator n=1 Tax=Anaeromonas frigoriresistens TaxID=2683708 RepID=A0A942UY75_9FIRM|nr:Lrp/AsnC family transcriptional regulator [Anaeromonas frigoriresistens]MBS4539785.1 Lrp/AsnC family transcriptional regulator [Anaeromonas frigoriresistens]